MNAVKKLICFLFVFIFIGASAEAERLHPEKWYVKKWCAEHGGKIEYVLPDQTRCDCVSSSHAVEVDFAEKWAEAIGQSLFYSLQTGRREVLPPAFSSIDISNLSVLKTFSVVFIKENNP